MNRDLIRFLRLALFVCFAFTGLGMSAFAMEGGQSPALRGYRDFLTGIIPKQGLLVRQDFYRYSGSEHSTIPQGQLNVNLRAYASILGLTAVTPYRLLGGDYAVAVRSTGLQCVGGPVDYPWQGIDRA